MGEERGAWKKNVIFKMQFVIKKKLQTTLTMKTTWVA